jgi:2-amino-4-hydroxy-6-hydroxymethyldihydropteridine diphosphokinase
LALAGMAGFGDVAAVSGLYETAPVGGPEQPPFLNAVVVVDSDLDARSLLTALAAIEDSQGRVRAERWGPRTLDLDIVASDGPVVDLPDLQVPHFRARERRFVLEPLVKVWPNAQVGQGATAVTASTSVTDQEVELLLDDWVEPDQTRGRSWVKAQIVLFILIALALVADGELPTFDLDWIRVLGFAVLIAGGGLVLMAARSLGKALTPLPEPLPDATMVEEGPYRLARHPMYGGVILLFLGASIALNSLVAGLLTALLVGFFSMKSNFEERQLRIAYPLYSGYRQRVRKRFVPFLI